MSLDFCNSMELGKWLVSLDCKSVTAFGGWRVRLDINSSLELDASRLNLESNCCVSRPQEFSLTLYSANRLAVFHELVSSAGLIIQPMKLLCFMSL